MGDEAQEQVEVVGVLLVRETREPGPSLRVQGGCTHSLRPLCHLNIWHWGNSRQLYNCCSQSSYLKCFQFLNNVLKKRVLKQLQFN